jgi:hypothetical protein
MESWIRILNFIPFIVNVLIKEEIEKPSCQLLSLIYDESLTCRCLNSNLRYFGGSTTIFLFMWRIMFAYLVVCR